MVMEYWSGWFDLWGELHHVYAAEGKTDVKMGRQDLCRECYMFPDLKKNKKDRRSHEGKTGFMLMVSLLKVKQFLSVH